MRPVPTALRPTAANWLTLLALIAPLASIPSVRIMGTLPIVFVVLILASCFALRQSPPPLDRPAATGLGAILVVAAASVLWAPTDSFLAGRLTKLLVLFTSGLVLFSVARAMTAHEQKRFGTALVLGTGFGIVLLGFEVLTSSGLYRLLTGTGLEEVEFHRVNRPLVMATLLFWPAAAVLAGRGPAGRAAAAAGFAGLLVVALSSTSQTAAVALAASGLAWLGARYRPRAALLAVSATAILAIALSPWIGPLLVGLEDLTQWQYFTAANVGPRLEIWTRAAEVAAAHPFLGVGLEGLRLEAIAGAEPGAIAGYEGANHPHNAAIQIRLEFGVLGLVLSSALIAALTLRLLGAPNRDLTVAVPVLTGLIAVSLISHGLWQSWWIGTIGLVAAATSAVLGTPPNPGVAGDGTTA